MRTKWRFFHYGHKTQHVHKFWLITRGLEHLHWLTRSLPHNHWNHWKPDTPANGLHPHHIPVPLWSGKAESTKLVWLRPATRAYHSSFHPETIIWVKPSLVMLWNSNALPPMQLQGHSYATVWCAAWMTRCCSVKFLQIKTSPLTKFCNWLKLLRCWKVASMIYTCPEQERCI